MVTPAVFDIPAQFHSMFDAKFLSDSEQLAFLNKKTELMKYVSGLFFPHERVLACALLLREGLFENSKVVRHEFLLELLAGRR